MPNWKRVIVSGSSAHLNNITASGNLYVEDSSGLYTDKVRRYSDSDNTTKILLNDELLKFYAGNSQEDIVRIGDTNKGNDNNFWVSGSIDSKGTSVEGTAVFGGDVVISGSVYSKHRWVKIDKFSKGTGGDHNKFYIKAEGTGNQINPGSTTYFIPPASGRLVSAHLRTNGAAMNSTTITLVTTDAGDNPQNTNEEGANFNHVETQTVDCNAAKTNFTFNFTSGATYTADQAISLRVSGSAPGGDGMLTTVWEYDFVS